MRSTTWLVLLRLFSCLFLCLFLAQGQATAEDEAGASAPPVLEYPASRESARWIELPGGTSVAVDRGAEWRGVRVYLALTWHLVAVDARTEKVLWDRDVSAFWNVLTFAEAPLEGGARAWVVELRPGGRDEARRSLRAWYRLDDGQPVEVPGQEDVPNGERFQPRAEAGGDQSRVAERFHLLVVTPGGWQAVRERLWGGEGAPDLGPIDFEHEVVLVVSDGNAWNCNGVRAVAAFEDERRILVRTQPSYFQTMDGGMKVRPWGVFVLPRREGKAYAVERNTQSLIGGPPLWKETWRAATLPAPEHELDLLPAASATPHEGWEK
jgi:hypothetical protein